MSLLAPRIFEWGPGKKYRARTDSSFWNGIRIEVRHQEGWTPVTALDLYESLLKILALAAIGQPIAGFRWTNDDRYNDGSPLPTLLRRQRGEIF